jgi:hypothetical protein
MKGSYKNFTDRKKYYFTFIILFIFISLFRPVYFTFLGFEVCISMDLLYILYGERNLVIHTKILTRKEYNMYFKKGEQQTVCMLTVAF